MNKLKISLFLVKNNRRIEVIFDKRLSFRDNINLLNRIICINDYYGIYDPYKELFIDDEIALAEFSIKECYLFYIF